jgi:15-cis-phytoene synthase
MAMTLTPREPARYFAWLYSEPPLKSVLQILLALEAEIGAALRPGMDHAVAHARMQWWQEECRRAADATAAHPLVRDLLDQRPRTGGAPDAHRGADIAGLTNAAVWDLAAATFETRRELAGYCDQWARALTGLAAEWTSPPNLGAAAARQFGQDLGSALRELELLSNLHADARLGRLRLPLDELERAGVDPAALARPPWPDGLVALLRIRHRALRASLRKCVAVLAPSDQSALRGLLVWAELAHRRSQQCEQSLPLPVQAVRSQALATAWHAWRSAQRATRGRFRIQGESAQ